MVAGPEAPSFKEGLRAAGLAFLVSGVVVFFFFLCAPLLIAPNSPADHPLDKIEVPWPLQAAMRWDAQWYATIVLEGYHSEGPNQQSDVAFWPLYPALVRGVLLSGTGSGYALATAGILISNAAFFLALLYLYALCRLDQPREVAQRAIMYMSLFPTAYYFRIFYPESLLLLCVTGAFYHWFRGQWARAGVLGFLAALSHPVGALVVLPFSVDMSRRLFHPPAFLAWLGAPLGGLFFMGVLKIATGDPMAFISGASAWTHHFQDPVTTVSQVVVPFATRSEAWQDKGTLLIVGTLGLFFLAIASSLRRERAQYTVWSVSVLALYLSLPPAFPPLASMPRYVLYLFPCFFIFAQWGQRRGVHISWTVISVLLLGVFSALFAQWYWVA